MMLEITVGRPVFGEVQIMLHGQLTHLTSEQLRAALTAVLNRGHVGTIRLDLRAVDAMDAAGVATLAVARRICQTMGVCLRLPPISAAAPRPPGLPHGQNPPQSTRKGPGPAGSPTPAPS